MRLLLILLCFLLTAMAEDHSNDVTWNFDRILDRLKSKVSEAYYAPTFAVGGLMINNIDGKIIYENRNRVLGKLQSGQIFFRNPTNHGERQAILWYWENKVRLNLPEPENVTIVTSLDPCMMCSGSILQSGFNVITVNLDMGGGININEDGKFERYSSFEKIRSELLDKFSYFAVDDLRGFVGPLETRVDRKFPKLNRQFYENLGDHFVNSITTVAHIEKRDSFISISKLMNPSTLDFQTSKLIIKLKTIFPDAFALNYKTSPRSQIHAYLKKLTDGHKGSNAVAMFDPFGNLLMAFSDAFEQSPVSTHLFKLINSYFNFYFEEISTDSVVTVGGYQNSETYLYLPNPRNCNFVFLNSPNGEDLLSLQTVGLLHYITAKKGANLYYINESNAGDLQNFLQLHKLSPPLYLKYLKRESFKKFDLQEADKGEQNDL